MPWNQNILQVKVLYSNHVYGYKLESLIFRQPNVSKLQRKRVRSFMKVFNGVYRKTRVIMGSGNSDAIERARI